MIPYADMPANRRIVTCPDCLCPVRADRLLNHRRKVHGWKSTAEKAEAAGVAERRKASALALGRKVVEESRQFYSKQRLKAALFRMKHPERRRFGPKRRKKRGWPGPEGMQSGHLLYSGAFEMSRRKH